MARHPADIDPPETDDVLILAMYGKTYGDPEVWAAACRVFAANRLHNVDPERIDWAQVYEGWYPADVEAVVA